MPDEKRKQRDTPLPEAPDSGFNENPFFRDTVPPTPDKAKLIENEISGEFDLSKLRKEISGTEDSPSIPPPAAVPLEQIKEGVQYRIIPTDIRPSSIPAEALRATEPASAPLSAPAAAWQTALEIRERKLRDFERELGDREERLLEREMIIGGREKLLAEREEKLRQREVRLRDWEAKLMDMQAEIRESSPPPKTAEEAPPEAKPKPVSAEAPQKVDQLPEEPRASSFKIEITSGGGGWELVDEPEPDEG